MNIRQHFHVEGTLQRSIVNHGMRGNLYRRIARWVNRDGELESTIPDAPIWQERIHTGEYHNVVDPKRVAELERDFIAALIEANKNS